MRLHLMLPAWVPPGLAQLPRKTPMHVAVPCSFHSAEEIVAVRGHDPDIPNADYGARPRGCLNYTHSAVAACDSDICLYRSCDALRGRECVAVQQVPGRRQERGNDIRRHFGRLARCVLPRYDAGHACLKKWWRCTSFQRTSAENQRVLRPRLRGGPAAFRAGRLLRVGRHSSA